MALGIVVVGGNMDPTDYYDKTTADKKFLTGITSTMVTSALGYTPPEQDTTYGNATTSKDGLMSAADKKKTGWPEFEQYNFCQWFKLYTFQKWNTDLLGSCGAKHNISGRIY